MTNKEWNRIGGIILLSICVFAVCYGFYRGKRLLRDHKLAYGYTSGCSAGGRGNWWYIDFSYELQGRYIKGSYSINEDQISVANCEAHIVGKYFPVVYNPGHPSNVTMLILPDDFDRYGYAFPDSLKWVLQYVK